MIFYIIKKCKSKIYYSNKQFFFIGLIVNNFFSSFSLFMHPIVTLIFTSFKIISYLSSQNIKKNIKILFNDSNRIIFPLLLCLRTIKRTFEELHRSYTIFIVIFIIT